VRFTVQPGAAELRAIRLRSAAGRTVPFTARTLPESATPPHVGAGFGASVLMELVPLERLEPNTKYELSWPASTDRHARPSIGKFHTGSRADTAPPVMPDTLSSVLVDYGWVVHTYKTDAPGPLPSARLRAWTHGLVRLDGVRDDLTLAKELYYWAWRVDAERSAFLLARPRFAFRVPGAGVLAIGDPAPPYECETQVEFPFPKGQREYAMAVVAVDLAGNASKPRYFVLDRRRLKRSVPKDFAY
jgi:hypothetical protein